MKQHKFYRGIFKESLKFDENKNLITFLCSKHENWGSADKNYRLHGFNIEENNSYEINYSQNIE